MRPAALSMLVAHLRQFAARDTTTMPSDAELLRRYSAEADELAFAGLMQRHGPMVWQVCRNVLRHDQDAEDAFQATFLVLARKAGAIPKRAAVAGWLHGVAYRVALRANRNAALRRTREREGAKAASAEGRGDLDMRELLAVVDEEVWKLPDRYRAAFVLCCLQSRSVPEAARLLDRRPGTVAVHLSRARTQLRERLAKRGVTIGAALSVMALTRSYATASPPAPLQLSVQAAAARGAAAAASPATVITANHGMVKAMFALVLKAKLVLLFALCAVGAGVALFARPGAGTDPALARDNDGSTTPAAQVALAEAGPNAKTPPGERTEPERVSAELREMRGTWIATITEERVVNRIGRPPRQVKVTYVIDGDKMFQLGRDGFIDEQFTLKPHPDERPKALDLDSPISGALGALYQLDGDALRIQIETTPGKRPTNLPADDKQWWLVLKRDSRTPAKAIPRYANAPGWFWMIEPVKPGTTMATAGIVIQSEKDRDGALLITLACGLSAARPLEHRPVVVDAAKKRFLPVPAGGGSSSGRDGVGVALSHWRLDPNVLSADKVDGIGVESRLIELPPAAQRTRIDSSRPQSPPAAPQPIIEYRRQ
jgi:RNA polymerase sigma factor (sigma-70 family)